MKLNPKHTTPYIIGGILVLAVVYGINKWLKSLNKPNLDYNSNQESTLDYSLVLSKGMEQPEVTELQKILKTKYKSDLGTFGDNKDGIDGIFGTYTENALFKAKGVKSIALKDL
jgi:peptidoglycan hydrolase-like protein with peptidoglycan-binding domain